MTMNALGWGLLYGLASGRTRVRVKAAILWRIASAEGPSPPKAVFVIWAASGFIRLQGTLQSISGRSTTLSCAVGLFRAPRKTAGVEVLLTATCNTLAERPSIAVLPFVNLSGDREQDYFADGVTDDIIVALTRCRWFHVIGRNTSFAYKGKALDSKQIARELGVHYVLEGSTRRSGNNVRIAAQLVDAATALQVWAERYEMEFTEVFAVQDAIAERVAGAIEPELLRSDSIPAIARHSGNVSAWDLVRRGTWLFHQIGRETHLRARNSFREAAALDQELAEAFIWLARVSAGLVAYEWTDTEEEDIEEGLRAAMRAIRLDGKNPYSHYALAIVSAYANAPEQAALAAEKAIEDAPSFALGHLVLGMAHLFRGAPLDAIDELERGLTLNARDPQNFVWLNLLAIARLFAGNGESGLVAVNEGRKVRPEWRPLHATAACCYAALGRIGDARDTVEVMRALEPGSGDALAPLRRRNPRWADQLTGWLRQAGWESGSGSNRLKVQGLGHSK